MKFPIKVLCFITGLPMVLWSGNYLISTYLTKYSAPPITVISVLSVFICGTIYLLFGSNILKTNSFLNISLFLTLLAAILIFLLNKWFMIAYLFSTFGILSLAFLATGTVIALIEKLKK